jgi:hypothetical protein
LFTGLKINKKGKMQQGPTLTGISNGKMKLATFVLAYTMVLSYFNTREP